MKYDLNKVKQAAKFLDEKHPGWFKKINVITLELGSTSLCILAQLYQGQSYNGVSSLGLSDKYDNMQAFGYCFIPPLSNRPKLDKLKRKWIKQISKRLEQPK